MAQWLERSPRR